MVNVRLEWSPRSLTVCEKLSINALCTETVLPALPIIDQIFEIRDVESEQGKEVAYDSFCFKVKNIEFYTEFQHRFEIHITLAMEPNGDNESPENIEQDFAVCNTLTNFYKWEKG
jgi:hypothetical protein